MEGRETEKKKSCKDRSKEKNFLQSELHCAGLSYCTRQKGTLAGTLYCGFNFLVLLESQFTWFSLQLGKRARFPFKGGIFCAHAY